MTQRFPLSLPMFPINEVEQCSEEEILEIEANPTGRAFHPEALWSRVVMWWRKMTNRPYLSLLLLAAALPVLGQTTPAETVDWTAGVSYEYDGSGNVKKIGKAAFFYDSARRLVRTEVSGYRTTYEYDAFGNRTRCRQALGTGTDGDCAGGFTIDAAENRNRIAEAGYDAAGNLTSLPGRGYSYDSFDMLIRQQGAGVEEEYIYTADDERVAVRNLTTGSWRWTPRDPAGKVLRELTSSDEQGSIGTGSWKWVKDYVWRGDRLLASRQLAGTGVTTYHYHLDHLGTPRRITDGNDNIVGVHDYFAFGPEVPGGTDEPSLTLLKFTAHERDLGLTDTPYVLDYMHARYYWPMLGRFLSVDPVMNIKRNVTTPQRWNRYIYAANNPLLRVDPDGRDDRIFVINTSNAGVFHKAAERHLNAAVAGTRFEGRVEVVGPFATAGQVRAFLGNADSTDLVAVIAHSGSTKEWAPGKGGMMFAELRGQWMTGATLATWASSGGGPGACIVAGCDSAQLAATVSAGANTTTLGTTAYVIGGELGMATAVALGALAQGQSPEAAAAAASQELKTPANPCEGNPSCDPNEVARMIAVPPQ